MLIMFSLEPFLNLPVIVPSVDRRDRYPSTEEFSLALDHNISAVSPQEPGIGSLFTP